MHEKRRVPLAQYLNTILSDKFISLSVFSIVLLYVAIFAYLNFQSIYSIPFSYLALTILIPILLTDSIKTVIESFYPRSLPKPKEDIAKVTAIIPSHNGEDNIKETLASLLKRFPHHQIIVASNGSTDSTADISKQMSVRVIEITEAVGKVHAINLALDQVKTPYTLILDDDTLIEDAVLPTNLLDEGYEGVAFRVLPVIEGALSLIQMHEYRKSMDIGRAFHNNSATVQTISGAIGLFHTTELVRQIQLHSREFSGEDLQRTLLIHLLHKKKGVVIADSTVRTFVPSTLPQLFNQRVFGWYPGLYANTSIYAKLLFKPKVPLRLRLDAFYICVLIVFMDPVRMVTLPVLLFSPTFLTIFFVVYLLLDLVPYVVLGHKEPVWVLLVSPFYGLFNFLTRFLSGSTFIFRRLAYKLGKAKFYDEYRHVRKYAKLFSGVITVCIYILFFSVYIFIRLLPTEAQSATYDDITQILQTKDGGQ